ncbi:MAG: glycosyltransferase family 4 protein [Dehalococcoidia bacterium]
MSALRESDRLTGAPLEDGRATAIPRPPVVLFTNSWMMGGMEEHILKLARGLRSRGHHVTLICPPDNVIAPLRAACLAVGVHVRVVSEGQGPRGAIRRLRALTRLLRPHRHGVLHLHLTGPYGGELVMAAATLAGMAAIVRTEHQPPERPPSLLQRWRMRAKDRALSTVLCVSSQNMVHFTRDLGRDARKFAVVHNCIDLTRFDPSKVDGQQAREALGLAPDAEVVGMVARLAEERKGGAVFLEMAARMAKRRARTRFVVVGDGPLRPALERQAEALGIASRFLFLGERRDIPELLAAMDVFVMPSLWEGGPYTVLEAMAMERPVVTTNVGMVADVMRSEEHALVVPPGDAGALAEAALRLLESADLRSRLAERGRRLATERFSEDHLVEGVLAIYEQALTKASGSRHR